MNVKELYNEAVMNNEEILLLLLDFLLFKKSVIQMDDDISKVHHYLQPKYKNKMNQHLLQYKKEREQ